MGGPTHLHTDETVHGKIFYSIIYTLLLDDLSLYYYFSLGRKKEWLPDEGRKGLVAKQVVISAQPKEVPGRQICQTTHSMFLG